MIDRVKNWLGIEGVKLELVLPKVTRARDGLFAGTLVLLSQTPQEINQVSVRLVERYGRGRGQNRLVDEYVLGTFLMEKNLHVSPNMPAEIAFAFSFQLMTSPIDDFSRKNFLYKGVAGLAKKWNRVHSEYRVEAEAKVKGTVLGPFAKQFVQLV